MCELKKWLIKTHRISVEVDYNPNAEPNGLWECDVLEMGKPHYHPIEPARETDDEALQDGLLKALKLINNK